MASGAAPDTLNGRHHLAAWLVAFGRNNREVAGALGYSETRVATLKQSQLFMVEVERCRRELREKAVGDFGGWLAAQTPATLLRAEELRDQADDLGVAARMTVELLNRIAPPVLKSETRRTISVKIDQTDARLMALVMAEDAGLDVPAAVLDGAARVLAPTVAFRPVDDAITEYERAEAGDG